MAYLALVKRENLHKVLLHERPEGVYVYVFESPTIPYPQRDYLQETLEQAMLFGEQELAIARNLWEESPDDPSIR